MTTKAYIEMNVKMHLPANKSAYHVMLRELAVMASNMGNVTLFRELYAEYLKVGSEIFWENDRAAQEKEVA
jgi:hypothetical protein